MRLLKHWTGLRPLPGMLVALVVALYAAPAAGPAQADLRELARRSPDGHVQVEAPPDGAPAYSNLSELAAASQAIVIARAEENRCRLTRDGKSVVTAYRMTVVEVLAGRKDLAELVVEIPGGWVKFPSGRSAEVVVPWFRRMNHDEEYLLFLTETDGGEFQPTGGPQGVFGLAWDYIKVHSGRVGDPVWRYAGLEVSDFIAMVKRELESPRP